ncbi:ferritin-like domain-containing protein [Sessilibacter sp. MAH4]
MTEGLFSRLSNAPTITDLQQTAQLALQVEFSTIPVYLSALYSIANTDSYAYQALRSVAIEEMFHVNQAANIIVALGALPKFTDSAVPVYPGYLPQANPNTTPHIGLFRASPSVFGDVFAGIESPAEFGAPPQGNNYDSIAQLYAAFVDAVTAYPENPFTNTGPGRQRTDIYIGKFGGDVQPVIDKESFMTAVNEIVKQGEGTVPAEAPLVPFEATGTYNHYGHRTDGTYGPILGTPYELSHFAKFRKVSLEPTVFPDTYPVISNPVTSDYTNPTAIQLATTFDQQYSIMLRAFEKSFNASEADPYFGVVLSIMHRVLPDLARSLMQTPAFNGGNSSVGPTAAPAWIYVNDESIKQKQVALNLQETMDQLANGQQEDQIRLHLKSALAGCQEILSITEKLDL